MAVPDSLAITNSLKIDTGAYYFGLIILAVLAYIVWKIFQGVWIKKLKVLLEKNLVNQYWGSTGKRYGFTEFVVDTKDPEISKMLLKVMLPSHKVYAVATDVLIALGKAERLPKNAIYEWGEQHLECVTYKTLFKIWDFCASYEANSPCEPKALTLLGQSYFRGLGVKRDFDKAVALFKKASDLGEDAASLMLATLSGAGLYGTPKDCDKYLSLITTKESEVVDVVTNIRSSTNRVQTCREILG